MLFSQAIVVIRDTQLDANYIEFQTEVFMLETNFQWWSLSERRSLKLLIINWMPDFFWKDSILFLVFWCYTRQANLGVIVALLTIHFDPVHVYWFPPHLLIVYLLSLIALKLHIIPSPFSIFTNAWDELNWKLMKCYYHLR